jgi:hypothetical protein
MELAHRWREQLRSAARELADHLFAEKPRVFRETLMGWWRDESTA